MKINQRDIIEVGFELPNGTLKVHPAIVISGENILNVEDIFYAVLISSSTANMDYAIELTNDMVTNAMRKRCFVKCHIIQSYRLEEVLNVFGSVRIEPFKKVKAGIVEAIFS